MNWPQITMAVLYAIGVGFSIAKHGEPRTGTHNMWNSLISVLLGIWLLNEGGFWK